MPNRLDNGISITLTYKEAVAVLRAMADAEFAQINDNDQLDSLPREEADVRRSWDQVKYKIYEELKDSAEHAT
jgi:hypothetical protein|tara:strand:- start:89 stop:307 length:219 start_codon:yes stop_codon:yes gene_type:complete